MDKQTIMDLKLKWNDTVGDTKKSCNFKQFCKIIGEGKLTKDECKALFKVYDVNKDGSISWHEYVCAMSLVTRGSMDEKVALVFHSFDENGDGKVSKEELAKAVRLFSEDGAAFFVDKVFKACDTDRNGTIDVTEFNTWVHSDPETYAQVCAKLNIEFS